MSLAPFGAMSHLSGDLRYAWRSLRKAPLFAAVAIASIALGVGANTAVFTLLDQVVLRLLPVTRPGEIVQVSQSSFYGGKSGDGSEMAYPFYRDLQEHNPVFSGMFAEATMPVQVKIGNAASRVNGELVSGSFFPVLGVQPALGRVLTADDDRVPGGHPVAVLGYAFWQGRFGGNPNVIGQALDLNGHAFTIVGVAQAGFDGLEVGIPVQVFVPIQMEPQLGPAWMKLEDRGFGWVRAFGRLKPGMTPEQAQVGMQPTYKSLLKTDAQESGFTHAAAEAKTEYLNSQLRVTPASRGRDGLRGFVEKPLWVLMAVVVGVLLIACANVANLLLARGSARQREVALRLALGASRSRIVSQLLVESLLLATAGCLAGLLIATWGATFLLQFFSDPDNTLTVSASPDARILAFTVAVSVLAALLFGLVPALQATRPELATTLKNQAPSVSGGHPGLRKGLVVAQVAVSLLLLIGSGLFLRSLNKLLHVDPGFRAENLVSFHLDPPLAGYSLQRSKDMVQTLMQRFSTTPGVRSSAFAFFGVLEGGAWGMTLTIEGDHLNPSGRLSGLCNAVSPGYFDTMGMRLIAGRDFRDSDSRTGGRVEGGWPYRAGIVNEAFVKRYFGQANPLGRRVGLGDEAGAPTPIEIVGVVKDAKYRNMREDVPPQLFVPYLEANDLDALTFYVRTTQDPNAALAMLTRTVHEVDPNLPVTELLTVQEQVARSLTSERLVASLSSAFSALATLLAAIGLYGVMAYSVARRTREIGIRVALGAVTRDVIWRVMREAALLVLGGLAIGLPAAWWLGRYVQSQLYNVQSGDPLTIAAAGVLLASIAGLAALIPARRAAKIDPVTALRQE